MKSVVSVKGQTVIPKEVREALGIKPGTRLHWVVKGGQAQLFVVPEDPVRASLGMLKGLGYTFQDFMRERNEERERERLKDEAEDERWRGSSSTPRP